MRRHERAHGIGAMFRHNIRETARHVFERGLPIDGLPFAAPLDHRCGESLFRIQRFVREAVLVREPAFVDRGVVERQHAHHPIDFNLHDQIAAQPIVG